MSLLFAPVRLPLLSYATNTALLPTLLIADEACGFEGDEGTYGRGIRLGLYLQWFTTSLADNFVPDEAIAMRGVNVCFQLSTFIALLYITFARPPSELYAVEVWILLSLCIGGVTSGRGAGNSTNGKQKPRPTFTGHGASRIGGLIRLALGTAMTFYGIWFLYVGMDGMVHPPCSTFAFYFTKVDLYHWYRTLLKVVFTIAAARCSFDIVRSLKKIFDLVSERGISEAAYDVFGFHEGTTSVTVQDGKKKVTQLRQISFGVDVIVLILSTEFAIKWNHIGGVQSLGSTAQLIPLVIGSTGLVKVLYKFIVKLVRGDYELADDFHFNFIGLSGWGIGLPRGLERKLLRRLGSDLGVNVSVVQEKAADSEAREDIVDP